MIDSLIITELFDQALSRFPDKVALQIKRDNQWQRLTYKDVQERSLQVATFLIQAGFHKGDAAILIAENRPEWVMIYLGIVRAGLICVPLDPQLNAQEIKNLVSDSAAKVIFCSLAIFKEKIKEYIQNSAVKTVVLDAPDLGHENLINFSRLKDVPSDKNMMPDITRQDIASLIYTSGTTALPKGVLLSHANICSNFQSIAKLNICLPSDNFLAILPLHHTYAFMITLIVPLFLGTTITYCLSFSPSEISRALKEADISILVGVPQLFSMLHKTIFERIKKIPGLFLPLALWPLRIKIRREWRGLRLLVSGGARLEPKIARGLTKLLGIKLVEGYGLTETSPVVTLNPPQKIKLGSVGKPIPDVQIKIFNPDKSGIGQVLIKGPNVMQGYFKHPEWTESAIKEGWFYSGDLGYIDKEGYLYLVGREKEVIVLSSGKNIYPEELEEYYGRSPYIKEICILGSAEEKFGQPIISLYAVVIPNLEYFRRMKEANIRAKIRWELENLGKGAPSYQHIMGFTVAKEELPRTALKKIKRYQVKEKYLKEIETPSVSPAVPVKDNLEGLNKDIAGRVIRYISQQTRKSVYSESHLELDLGIDSLTRVELGLGLEEIFKVKIPDELLYGADTVKEIILNLSKLIEAPLAVTQKAGATAAGSWSYILSQTPEDKILRKIRIEPRFLAKLFTRILQGILLSVFRVFWFLRIEGSSNLPLSGPYIICSNHASYLDGFLLFSSIKPIRAINLFFLGYSAILEKPFISWAAKSTRLISIDPNMHLIQALQAASFVLAQKKIVCIFPEGRRSIDENMGEFKKGIGILVKELDVAVVPAYIKGSHYSWPRTSRLPRIYPLKIIFGRPLSKEELLKNKEGPAIDDYGLIAQRLREEIAKLAC